MHISQRAAKDFFTEEEAAQSLGISRERLHFLLDKNVFNDGKGKPSDLHFRAADLAMIGFWDRNTPLNNIVHMPRH